MRGQWPDGGWPVRKCRVCGVGIIVKPRLVPPGYKAVRISDPTWKEMERLWNAATQSTLSALRSAMAGAEAGATISCPYCDSSGWIGDSTAFDFLGKPPGGDAVYGCRSCKTMLLLVPTEAGDEFRIVLADGREMISDLLDAADQLEAEGARVTAEVRDLLRALPFTTDDVGYVD